MGGIRGGGLVRTKARRDSFRLLRGTKSSVSVELAVASVKREVPQPAAVVTNAINPQPPYRCLVIQGWRRKCKPEQESISQAEGEKFSARNKSNFPKKANLAS